VGLFWTGAILDIGHLDMFIKFELYYFLAIATF